MREGCDSDFSGPVFVVNQIDQRTGAFDEHKCMIGWNSLDEAKAAYLDNFTKPWKVGPITQMRMADFKSWLRDGDTTQAAKLAKGDESGHEFHGNQWTTMGTATQEQMRQVRIAYHAYTRTREEHSPGKWHPLKEQKSWAKTEKVPAGKILADPDNQRLQSKVDAYQSKTKDGADPFALKLGDHYYLQDGHHRVEARGLKGQTSISLKVIDLNGVVATKFEKAMRGQSATPIKRAITPHIAPLQATIYRRLQSLARQIAAKMARKAGLKKTQKEVEELLAEIANGDWEMVGEEMNPELRDAFARAGYGENEEAGAEIDLDLIDAAAVEYADARAAELVTEISDTTRDQLRGMVADALEESYTTGQLADALEDSFSFSEQRAGLIARTELATAHTHGRIDVAKQAGGKRKKWLLSADHDDDASCDCSAAADAGEVDMDDSFTDDPDYDFPPGHPNCWCDWVAVYGDDDDDDEDDEGDEDD